MEEKTNSMEYWNRKFLQSWDNNNGEKQTEYFCKMFLKNLPDWIKKEIDENKYSIIDLGCAEGEAVNTLSDFFKNSEVTGLDFSVEALKKAKDKYPKFQFIEGDLTKKIKISQDIIFCSNTLEHFKDPKSIIKNITDNHAKYIFIMIPMNDNPYSAENGEHEYFFDYNDFETEIGDYNLLFFKVLDSKEDEKDCWVGSQAILIYTLDKNISFENNVIADLDNYLNYQICQCAKVLCLNNAAEKKKMKEKYLEEVQEWKEKYENLYKYSSSRDNELQQIQNSRSYKLYIKCFRRPMQLAYKIAFKIYRMIKALFTLNLNDLGKEIGSPFIRVKNKITRIFTKSKLLKEINKSVQNKNVIILPPTLDWYMPLFQRPQQLALSYSKKKDTIVIYMTKNIQYDRIAVADRASDSLWIVNEALLDLLNLNGSKQKILSLSWTPNKFYLDKIKPDKLIYEYIDELEIFHMYGPEMEKDHQELLQKADVTVCTATKLYNQVLNKAKNPIISTNAGDYDFFVKTNQFEINDLVKDKLEKYDYILGYYGAVAKWFDYDLIKEVAAKKKNWLWLIVGINYDGTLDKSGILDLENVLYIPPQPYKLLPTFLKAFDLATIPFVINEITLSTSPVKLFEYMASGKPVLTSKMPECLKYGSVYTYENVEEFIEKAIKLMNLKDTDDYWHVLDNDAKNNTWDSKTDEILDNLT